jgi:hypothetical protein
MTCFRNEKKGEVKTSSNGNTAEQAIPEPQEVQ